MTLPRIVSAETLDGLAESDPAAIRSRRDLQRVHRAMGTRRILLRVLRKLITVQRRDSAPLRVLELGAGDGSLMLGIARAVELEWPMVEFTLLDRQNLVDRATLAAYAEVGWAASARVVDVLDWAASDGDSLVATSVDTRATARWDLIVATLFLHHFDGAQLALLLAAIAARSDRFNACEPRRTWLALAGSHLIGAIGANAVTREDAVLSVHAGFRDAEISALWPASARGGDQLKVGGDPLNGHVAGLGWELREHSAGLFSHCFVAQRVGVGAGRAEVH